MGDVRRTLDGVWRIESARLLGGLTAAEIARAYLAPEATVAQRIVRAKRTLSAARVPFEIPERRELAGRLASVLEVIYLVFNEGYAATAGERWLRPELLEEALRLGRILAELLPAEAEVHGLVALMELQASRARARIGPGGAPVLLLDQDRSRWNWMLVERGLAALERAYRTGGALGPRARRCHQRGAGATRLPPPADRSRRSAREGGRKAEASREFQRAAAMTGNARERAVLLERMAACAPSNGS